MVVLLLPCLVLLEKLDRIIFFCKKTVLSIEGREMELLSFLVFLEANRMKGDLVVEEAVGMLL